MDDLDAIPPQVDALQSVRQAVEPEREPASEHTRLTLGEQPQAVVVRGRSPELRAGAAEEGAAAVPAQLCQQATLARDCGLRFSRLEDDEAALLAGPRAPRRSRTRLAGRQRNLLPRHLVTGGSPGGCAPEKEPEVDEPFSATASVDDVDPDRCAAARLDTEPRQRPLLDDRAVPCDLPRAAEGREVGEVEAADDAKAAGAGVDRLDTHRLGQVLELEERRMRRTVGPDEAVRAEVRVVRLVAEVAAVRPVLAPVRRRVCTDPVVDPFPDEAALERAVRSNAAQ